MFSFDDQLLHSPGGLDYRPGTLCIRVFPVRAGTGGADKGHFKWPGGAEPEASLQIRGQAGPPRPAGVPLSRLDCSQDPTLQTKAEGEDQPSSSW